MKKLNRQEIIKDIIKNNNISSQDMLLNMLVNKGFNITQATLSRDIKELKIIKIPDLENGYIYQLVENEDPSTLASYGFVSIEFSGQLAVIKTRPGYAMAVAGEIDTKATHTILGTVAGDDTILLIPKENISRQEVIKSLANFIPNI